MTKNEIRTLFTQKVSDLMAKGYVLNPETMGGSQGEIAHIDLTNGSEIIRVLMETSFDHTGYGDILSIRVGRATDDCWGGRRTIWNNRLETLSEIKLAKISESFYTTLEEGQRMAELRYSRWRTRDAANPRGLGDAYKSVALRWLRRQPRMKSCRLEDITSMTRKTREGGAVCFEIKARGKVFYLHA